MLDEKVDGLYLICQRYKFESKSQPMDVPGVLQTMLYLICQRYKFESKSQREIPIIGWIAGCI